jgi:hypothetical protein
MSENKITGYVVFYGSVAIALLLSIILQLFWILGLPFFCYGLYSIYLSRKIKQKKHLFYALSLTFIGIALFVIGFFLP